MSRCTPHGLAWSVALVLATSAGAQTAADKTGHPDHPQKMTPQEWAEYQQRDKVAEAIRILDDPTWSEHDPWIRYQREADARQPEHARRGVQDLISDREVDALGEIVASGLPRDRRRHLLAGYLAHRNQRVATTSLLALVHSALWTPQEGIAYVRGHDPSVSAWHALLTSLPREAPQEAKRIIGRELIDESKNHRSPYSPGTPPAAEIDAVRVLVSSSDGADRARVAWTVRKFPDEQLLWAAAGRLPDIPPDVKAVARQVYADESKPLPVRDAAALVVARDDPDVLSGVVDDILRAVREFATLEYKESFFAGISKPPDTNRAERYARAHDMERFLAVVHELPVELLRPHVAEFVHHPYMTLGSGVCCSLARRLPDEFLRAVEALPEVPEELAQPLMIAARFRPAIASRVERLLPPEAAGPVQRAMDSGGTEALSIARLTLWD